MRADSSSRRMIRVYHDPHQQDQDGAANQFLLGYRGSQFMETGFIIAQP